MSIIKQNKNNISKDMKGLRKRYSEFSVNKVVEEVKRYYRRHSYDEKTLLSRIQKLETESSLINNLFSATLGTILALVITPVENMGSLMNSNLSKVNNLSKGKALLGYISILIFFLLFVTITAGIIGISIIFLKKINSFIFRSEGRTKYLNEKEIEIIKFVIENSDKKKRIKNRRYKSYRYKHRPRTY